ncbi:hypothetical protein DFP72DRAFT_401311 [Ephemerocybe angulata]|uniref:Uncharacterized protein n=1 Tax=Ephemerocybe angulata TaxID=980116 RepID=A0A8H6HWJ9_9AGAR|nr:hypothetical protein DFP72DRAFT_401311 [Tulosesus angulatus]
MEYLVRDMDIKPAVATQSFDAWKGTVCALYCIAAASAIPGLVQRVRARLHPTTGKEREASWTTKVEPYLSVVLSCLGVVAGIVLLYVYDRKDRHYEIEWQTRLYFVLSVAWVSIIWFARISLALTLSHSIHPIVHRLSLGLALSSAMLYIGHLVWMLATGCHHHGRLLRDVRTSAYCNAKKDGVDVIGFIVIYMIELFLFATAVYATVLSRKTQSLPSNSSDLSPRFLLPPSTLAASQHTSRAVLIGSLLMFLTTIVHSALYYSPLITSIDGLLLIDMTSHLEGAFSILASALPSLVLWITWLRSRRSAGSPSRPSHSRQSSRSSQSTIVVEPDLKIPANVIVLGDLSASSRERDRKLGSGMDDAESDTWSVRSGRSSITVKNGEVYVV